MLLRAALQVLQVASSMEKEKKSKAVPADISPCLHEVAVWEMKHIRKLSHLCALTYLPHKVNVSTRQPGPRACRLQPSTRV